MAKSVIKMVYIAAQYRIRLEIFPSQFFEFNAPPKDLFKRAKQKLEAEYQKGDIVYYEFYEEKLRQIWKMIRKNGVELDRPLSFTLAVATPQLNGIRVNAITDGPFIGYLELLAKPEQIKEWRHQLISVYVRYLLKEEQITDLPDPTFIHRACDIRSHGSHVRAFPLYRFPETPENENKYFHLVPNSKHGMVNVILFDMGQGVDDKIIKQVIRGIRHEAALLEEEYGYRFEIEKESVVRRIRSANRGPESYGFDMPLTILGAYQTSERLPIRQRFKTSKIDKGPDIGAVIGVKKITPNLDDFKDPYAIENNKLVVTGGATNQSQTGAAKIGSQQHKSKSPGDKTPDASGVGATPEAEAEAQADFVVPEPKVNLHKYIQVEVTPDKLAAIIEKFDVKIYEEDVTLSKAQWLKFLDGRGIKFGTDKPYADLVLKKWGKKEDLSGMKIAQGEAAIKAETPFLYPTFKHKQEGTYREPGAPRIDKENAPQRLTPMLFAAVGDIVAEVRYEQMPKAGTSVFGKPMEPPKASSVAITVGEGVEAKDNTYIALINGIPKVDKESAAVEKALVIEGDVSMATGNIEFEGPVKVTGNIEEGSIVTVDGDLTVEGRVSGGQISVTGNLVATEGLVPAPGSNVRVGGSVEAEFIESANFQCGGNIKALKSIMNSQLLAMKKIMVVEDDGVISGGSYTCGEGLSTFGLGLSMGTGTKIFVGSDIKAERSYWIRNERAEGLEKHQNEVNASLGTLNEIPTTKLNKEKKEKKIALKKKLKKLKTLVAKAKTHASEAKSDLAYNKKATIEIRGILSSNCDIILAGVTIQNHEDLMAVRLKLGAGEKNMESLIDGKKPGDDAEAEGGDAGEKKAEDKAA